MSPVVKSVSGGAGATPEFVDAANQKLTPTRWLINSRTCHDWHGVGFDNWSDVTFARTDRVLAKARSIFLVLMSGSVRDRLPVAPTGARSTRRTLVDDGAQFVEPTWELPHR